MNVSNVEYVEKIKRIKKRYSEQHREGINQYAKECYERKEELIKG